MFLEIFRIIEDNNILYEKLIKDENIDKDTLNNAINYINFSFNKMENIFYIIGSKIKTRKIRENIK